MFDDVTTSKFFNDITIVLQLHVQKFVTNWHMELKQSYFLLNFNHKDDILSEMDLWLLGLPINHLAVSI